MIILGQGKSLQTTLITNITGKDLSTLEEEKISDKTVTYQNDIYKFTQTPDFKEDIEDIKKIFSGNQNPDMCLLVVNAGFSEDEVTSTIQSLSKMTGKSKDYFAVVLPLLYEGENPSGFRSYNLEELVSELNKKAEEKQKKPPKSR